MRYSQQQITADDEAAVLRALRSDWLTCGPEVDAFEAELAEYVGAKYAVAVNSGTAALYLAYLAARPYRVMTSPLTFVATANAALLAHIGTDVCFHDIDPETGNVDLPGYTDCLSVPVHYAGRAAPVPTAKAGRVIEDAAHALGATDFDGCSRVGSCAHSLATCFSFHPVKAITTGEGGAVTTNDQGFADEVRSLRSHGRDAAGLMHSLSGNYRMPDLNAALGRSQLKRCDENREKRFRLARKYTMLMDEWAQSVSGQQTPGYVVPKGCAWHLYPIRIKGDRRDAVKAALNAQGIEAQVHYNPPVHLHPYYRARYGYKPGDFPNAEAWAAEALSLPLHAGLTEADVERVVDALREALK